MASCVLHLLGGALFGPCAVVGPRVVYQHTPCVFLLDVRQAVTSLAAQAVFHATPAFPPSDAMTVYGVWHV